MATQRKGDQRTRQRPAKTLKDRENQVISKAFQLAERQIEDGTASAQVLVHYLKLGSSREQLEQERLARENELLRAKVETLASGQRTEDIYKKALKAMRTYAGQDTDEDEDEEYD
jgi:hypothetical protein